MSFVDPALAHRAVQPMPVVVRGIVQQAPASESDHLVVAVIDGSSEGAYTIPSGQWTPRGTALPTVGATALLERDHHGDFWVSTWVGLGDWSGGGSIDGGAPGTVFVTGVDGGSP